MSPGKTRVAGYIGYVWTTQQHALALILRRRRVIYAGLAALLPAIIPPVIAVYFAGPFAADGNQVFVRLIEHLYIGLIAPAAALLFGTLLMGEDVESQTMPYYLTRPIPRSAWVLGRFLAYATTMMIIFLPALGLVYAGCLVLSDFSFSTTSLILLLQYMSVMLAALFTYGTLCLMFGALLKRPMIVGILFVFAWERLATLVPGVVDFLTIRKYVNELLPKLATERQHAVFQTALGEFAREEFFIGAGKSLLILTAIGLTCLAITSFVIRYREFTPSRAMGGR